MQTRSQKQKLVHDKEQQSSEVKNNRKENRQQIFSQNRKLFVENNSSISTNKKRGELLIVDKKFGKEIEQFLCTGYSMDNFSDLIKDMRDSNIVNQLRGMIGIRKILSTFKNPPIHAVVDAKLVPLMIEFIKQKKHPQLQLQATWALANVAAGTNDQCQQIVNNGGIPLIVNLLKSKEIGIVEQAIWAINNISNDSSSNRDIIVMAGGLKHLIELMDTITDKMIQMKCCQAIGDLCSQFPALLHSQVRQAIQFLCSAIVAKKFTGTAFLINCCSAIHKISNNLLNIQTIINSGAVLQIIDKIEVGNDIKLVIPCIGILSFVSKAAPQYINRMLVKGVLGWLKKLLDYHSIAVRRDVCRIVYSIADGSLLQVKALLRRQDILKSLLHLFQTDDDCIKRQVCKVFSNLAHFGQPQQIFNYYKATGIVRYYINSLCLENDTTVGVMLECLSAILAHGQKFKENGKNPLVEDIYSLKGVEQLEKLQQHSSECVYQNVRRLLQTYFKIKDF